MSVWKRLLGIDSAGRGKPNTELIKRLLRETRGARGFLQQAQRAGFRVHENAPAYLMLARGKCRLTITVLSSRGPDTIWSLSVLEQKGSGIPIQCLVDEGKLQFDEKHSASAVVAERELVQPSAPTERDDYVRPLAVQAISTAEQVAAFHSAVKGGDLRTLKTLIRENPGLVLSKHSNDDTALHAAAKCGRKDVAKLLLASGAEVNAEDKDGHTPLHWAVMKGRKELADLLREVGGQNV